MSSVIVRGSAHRLVEPDRAIVSLGLSVVASDAPAALDEVSRRSQRLARVLEGLAIDRADWVTDAVNVAEEWEWRKDTNTLVGHRASSGAMVTVRDIGSIAALLREAVGGAGAQVRGLEWQVDDDNPIRIDVLGAAATDARVRAFAYAAALGLTLGAVELISEAPIGSTPATAGDEAARGGSMRMMKAQASSPELSMSGGQVELTAAVHVRFALLA